MLFGILLLQHMDGIYFTSILCTANWTAGDSK